MVGDWLGDARENDVFEHAGARDVIRREDFAKTGATTMREVLNRIPGVSARGKQRHRQPRPGDELWHPGPEPAPRQPLDRPDGRHPRPLRPLRSAAAFTGSRSRSATWMPLTWYAVVVRCVTDRRAWAAW
ncbi:hypothetical protein O5707_19555 [Escherichia coli]|nr:hypothetical protein [Escherichia coli]